ncbi:serine carboxypeptidase-like 40 [Andrographis paniculata]|uniref:serine carboxypeptidase-like 40 n=1 Tax=Andrographis paniculata TaxID=175694 RepID=UPI0021E8F178|nr:serine carboxypeptidase-like 40 [Andrographis paniculata]
MAKATAAAGVVISASTILIIIIIVISLISVSETTASDEALWHIYNQANKLLKSKTTTDSEINFNYDEVISKLEEARLVGGANINEAGMKDEDEIERLPGQPTAVNFKQYGGYVSVGGGAFYYYYFVEAQADRHKHLPLLLWLNGGPGCSSLGYGAMEELGPFRVHRDGKTLYHNPFAWNHVANVLFVESPAGVGFSYLSTTMNYTIGDTKTAIKNYVFLLNWMERFPEYKNSDFYISGESYAGHYVPQLGQTILYHNLKTNETKINLKGIMIGNPVINDETDIRGIYEYLGSHALVSEETTDRVMKYCFSTNATTQIDKCNSSLLEAVGNTQSINIYNIYAPVCHNSSLDEKHGKASVKMSDPCIDNYVYAYLNRVDVQKALHANVTNIPYKWRFCSDEIVQKWQWQDSPSTILPILKELMSKGIRVWIYSGDIDGRLPVTSTQHSIKQMKLVTKIPWHPWYLARQVGGYTQVYEENLTFATIRGAGHMVPTDQPARALSLIRHFLAGTQLPSTIQ